MQSPLKTVLGTLGEGPVVHFLPIDIFPIGLFRAHKTQRRGGVSYKDLPREVVFFDLSDSIMSTAFLCGVKIKSRQHLMT